MLRCSFIVVGIFLTLSLQDVIGQFSSTPPPVVIVNESDPLSLECSHFNTTNITWQRNDNTLISDDEEGYILTTLPPALDGGSQLNITSVSVETHNGSYSCVATLPGGMVEEVTFDIIVQFIGDVSVDVDTDLCARENVYVSATVSLKCNITDAYPSIDSITWFFVDDSNLIRINTSSFITLSDDGFLNITGASAMDTGEYLCRVGSNGGQLQKDSDATMITVITSPPARTVNLKPLGPTLLVQEGGETDIICMIFPPSPPFMASQIGWRRNGIDIVSDPPLSILSHPCNPSLIISNTSASHVGTYTCYLRDGDTTISSEGLTLSLARIPLHYRVDISRNVDLLGVGRSVSFLCLEDPEDQIHNVDEEIGWQFIRHDDDDRVTRNVVGDGERIRVGTRNLSIARLEVADSGTYICVARHPLVAPILTSVNLTVEVAPDLSLTLSPTVARLETSIVLTCTIDSTSLTDFNWTRNGEPLQSNDIINITTTPTQSTLHITSVRETDLGANITCMAFQSLHLPLLTAVIIMEETQPYLIGNRRNEKLLVENETSLVLHCPLRGNATSPVQWFEGQKRLLDGVDGAVFSDGSLTVTLHNVTVSKDDGDQYSCKVIDDDIDLRYNVTLFITVRGNITSFPPTTSVLEGSRVRLDCEVSGRPLPQVSWLRLNMDLQQNIVNGSLIFDMVQLSDKGMYICYIQEPVISHTIELNVTLEEKGSELFNTGELILVFSVVGVVALILFVICPVCVVTGCCYWLQSRGGHFKVPKECYIDGEAFSKQSSLSRKDKEEGSFMAPSPNPIFSTLQYSRESSHFTGDEGYGNSTHVPSNVVPMETFTVGSASLLSDSHTSSPMRGSLMYPLNESSCSPLHVTMASNSIFSSEAHTVLDNGLPCFSRNNVKLGDMMGQGEFGPVMKAIARNLVPGQFESEVAVKLLVSESVVDENGFRADLAIMDYANQMKLEYTNISSILGLCSDKEPYYVIYEYLDRGDLKKFLMESRPEAGAPPTLMDYDLLKIIGQVSSGMNYLFSQRIIHGDIASRNCLVSSELNVKIGDLGIGHELYANDYHDNGAQLLPIRWMPPELLSASDEGGPSFSLHSDVWSFGVFCWEVLSYARLPYDSYSDEEVLVMIPAGSRLRAPSQTCPHQLYLVMMDCWNEIPERRPEFTSIIAQLDNIDLNQ